LSVPPERIRGVTTALCEPAQALSDCLDGVRGTLSGLVDKVLLQRLREIEVLSRKAQSVMLDLVAEIDSRGIAGREGFGSTQRLLAGMLHLSAAEARMRLEHVALVGTRSTLSGETLPPRLPETPQDEMGGVRTMPLPANRGRFFRFDALGVVVNCAADW
jgi:hypothetical protein